VRLFEYMRVGLGEVVMLFVASFMRATWLSLAFAGFDGAGLTVSGYASRSWADCSR
jgi:hypothetical protein